MNHDPEVTGSSNISKVTPEWATVLAQARAEGAQLYQEPYLMHVAVSIINEEVVNDGAQWSKCANCGCPFRVDLDVPGRSPDICSGECYDEYVAYLNSPEGQGRYDEQDEQEFFFSPPEHYGDDYHW